MTPQLINFLSLPFHIMRVSVYALAGLFLDTRNLLVRFAKRFGSPFFGLLPAILVSPFVFTFNLLNNIKEMFSVLGLWAAHVTRGGALRRLSFTLRQLAWRRHLKNALQSTDTGITNIAHQHQLLMQQLDLLQRFQQQAHHWQQVLPPDKTKLLQTLASTKNNDSVSSNVRCPICLEPPSDPIQVEVDGSPGKKVVYSASALAKWWGMQRMTLPTTNQYIKRIDFLNKNNQRVTVYEDSTKIDSPSFVTLMLSHPPAVSMTVPPKAAVVARNITDTDQSHPSVATAEKYRLQAETSNRAAAPKPQR